MENFDLDYTKSIMPDKNLKITSEMQKWNV